MSTVSQALKAAIIVNVHNACNAKLCQGEASTKQSWTPSLQLFAAFGRRNLAIAEV